MTEKTDALTLTKGKPSEEIVGGGERPALLANLAERVALDVKSQEGQKELREPRILRLLKILNPSIYEVLKNELAALLTTLSSSVTPEALKIKLREQLKRSVQARLGPVFRNVTVAESMLSNGEEGFYLDSAGAAIADMPETLKEVPDQRTRAVEALQIMTALRILRTTRIEASWRRLQKLTEDYIFGKLRETGCEVKLKTDVRGPHKLEVTTFTIAWADFPKFKEVIETAEAELGIDIIAKDSKTISPYRPSDPEECEHEREMGRPDNVRAGCLWFTTAKGKSNRWDL